jgi:hypothetical protein
MDNSKGTKLEKLLEFMKLNKAITPTEIRNKFGQDFYVSKGILYLKLQYGVEFQTKKDGKNVVSYMRLTEPTKFPKKRKKKDAPAVVAVPVKTKKVAPVKIQPVKAKAAMAKKSEKTPITLAAPGPSSYTVDPAFDDYSDIADLA